MARRERLFRAMCGWPTLATMKLSRRWGTQSVASFRCGPPVPIYLFASVFPVRELVGIAVKAAAIAKGLPISSAISVLSNLSVFMAIRKIGTAIATNAWTIAQMQENLMNGDGFPTVIERTSLAFSFFADDGSTGEKLRLSDVYGVNISIFATNKLSALSSISAKWAFSLSVSEMSGIWV